jgi:hypothetical protein
MQWRFICESNRDFDAYLNFDTHSSTNKYIHTYKNAATDPNTSTNKHT